MAATPETVTLLGRSRRRKGERVHDWLAGLGVLVDVIDTSADEDARLYQLEHDIYEANQHDDDDSFG